MRRRPTSSISERPSDYAGAVALQTKMAQQQRLESFMAWYCAARMELILKTVVVPLYGASNYVAVFEGSPTGGMAHLHYILWKKCAPRFIAERDSRRAAGQPPGTPRQWLLPPTVAATTAAAGAGGLHVVGEPTRSLMAQDKLSQKKLAMNDDAL